MMMFDVSHFHLFTENYGHEWTFHLLKEIASRLQDIVGVKGIAGRLYTDHFMIVRQVETEDEVREVVSEVMGSIEEIKDIDGVPCSIYLNSGYTLFSEAKDLQVMYEYTEKRLKGEK